MKKNIYYLLTFFVAMITLLSKVYATDGIAVWLNCDYEVHHVWFDNIDTGRSIVYTGGWDDYAEEFQSHYRLINPGYYTATYAYDHNTYRNHNPKFDNCWFKNADDIGKNCWGGAPKYSQDEINSMLAKGVCPAKIRQGLTDKSLMVFAGISESSKNKVYYHSKQYRFYKLTIKDSLGKFLRHEILARGFDKNASYISTIDGVNQYTYDEMSTVDANKWFWTAPGQSSPDTFTKVAEEQETVLTGVPNQGFEILFDSVNNIDKLHAALDKWYKETSYYTEQLENDKVYKDNSKVIQACNKINTSYAAGKKYYFTGDYNAEDVLVDLEKLYNDLKSYYTNDLDEVKYKNCGSSSSQSNPVFAAFNCAMTELLGNLSYVPAGLQPFILDDIDEYLSIEKGIFLEKNPDEILKSTLECSRNIYDNYNFYNLTIAEVTNMIGKYIELGATRGIRVNYIHNCEALLGDELIKKINSYLNIVKIVAPIIIIIFAIIDFTKALFQGDEEMKKAQQAFIKRVLISIILFFTPTLVNLILTIANQVWSNISPNNCGLFN